MAMSDRATQAMCLDTTSSGADMVLPHLLVVYVEMVMERESIVQPSWASLNTSRVFRRLRDMGMCCPGAMESGFIIVGIIRGLLSASERGDILLKTLLAFVC